MSYRDDFFAETGDCVWEDVDEEIPTKYYVLWLEKQLAQAEELIDEYEKEEVAE